MPDLTLLNLVARTLVVCTPVLLMRPWSHNWTSPELDKHGTTVEVHLVSAHGSSNTCTARFAGFGLQLFTLRHCWYHLHFTEDLLQKCLVSPKCTPFKMAAWLVPQSETCIWIWNHKGMHSCKSWCHKLNAYLCIPLVAPEPCAAVAKEKCCQGANFTILHGV